MGGALREEYEKKLEYLILNNRDKVGMKRDRERKEFRERGYKIRKTEIEKEIDGIGMIVKKEEGKREEGERQRGSRKERGGTRGHERDGRENGMGEIKRRRK